MMTEKTCAVESCVVESSGEAAVESAVGEGLGVKLDEYSAWFYSPH